MLVRAQRRNELVQSPRLSARGKVQAYDLLLDLIATQVCSGVASKTGSRKTSQAAPEASSVEAIETYDADEGLVRASAGVAAPDPRAIIEEVASEFRRGLLEIGV